MPRFQHELTKARGRAITSIDLREGEGFDAESGRPHVAHINFGAMVMTEFFDKGLGQDDRFRYPDQPAGQAQPGRTLAFNPLTVRTAR